MANQPKNRRRLLSELCSEAVAAHGADWPAIERYVSDKLGEMDVEDRASLMRGVREILKYEAPDKIDGKGH